MTTVDSVLLVDSRDEAFGVLEDELGVLMGRVRRAVAASAHTLHPELQSGSYLIFSYVCTRGPVRATTVGEMYAIDKGSVSRHVQQLVDLGLIARQPDPQDRRAQLLSATDLGRKRIAEIAGARRGRFQDRMADWSDEDIAHLASLLARYNTTQG